MRLLDWVYRTTYYYGFRSAIALARDKASPFGRRRYVMVRQESTPGSHLISGRLGGSRWGIKADEAPVQAAIREASEELGLQLALEDLRHVLAIEHLWNNRRDMLQIFEVELSISPKIKITTAKSLRLASLRHRRLCPCL
jgi:8-oxo-dGTP pyrophosphatase MutT (NUDIX family)